MRPPAPEFVVPANDGATIDQGKARKNAGKPPLHLLPPDALVMVSWVLAFGAEKYWPRGWEAGTLSWSDCARALLSHCWKWMLGQQLDDESGCPHVAHIACNALFLCAFLARGIGKDDRPETAAQALDVWNATPEFEAACARERAAKAAKQA